MTDSPQQQKYLHVAIAMAVGAGIMYLLCSHRPGMIGLEGLEGSDALLRLMQQTPGAGGAAPPLSEGLSAGLSAEYGIYVGTSRDILRRTGGAKWEGRYPIVVYDPNTELRFAGQGIYHFKGMTFEILSLSHGFMCVRVVPFHGRPDNEWDVDLWINGRFVGPTAEEVDAGLRWWQQHYSDLPASFGQNYEDPRSRTVRVPRPMRKY